MSSIWRRICETRCRWPDRQRRVAGQRHVDAVLGQPRCRARRASSSAVRSLEQRLERLAHLVGLPCPTGPALLGRQLADRAQRGGQLGLAARGSAPAAPRARPPCRRPPIAASASLRSWAGGSAMGGHPIGELVEATVAAIATLSDSWPHLAHAASASVGLAARPGSPSRSAPRQRTTGGPSSASREAALAVRVERERAPGQLVERRARAGGRANSEPMLARTAFGENGSAQPGPRTTGPSRQRVRRADDRARRCRGRRPRAGRRSGRRRARDQRCS